MTRTQSFLLSLLLLPVGLIAGLDFFALIGDIPAAQAMSLPEFVRYWQALNLFLPTRMPVVAAFTLLLFLICIAAFWRSPLRTLLLTLVACFFLEAAGILVIVIAQLPVDHTIQALNAASLSDPTAVEALRQTTIGHFHLTQLLEICSFVWLLFVSMASCSSREAR